MVNIKIQENQLTIDLIRANLLRRKLEKQDSLIEKGLSCCQMKVIQNIAVESNIMS